MLACRALIFCPPPFCLRLTDPPMTQSPSLLHPALISDTPDAVSLHAVTADNWADFAQKYGQTAADFGKNQGFSGQDGQSLFLPKADGQIAAVLCGVETGKNEDHVFAAGRIAANLPAGTYRLGEGWTDTNQSVLAFLLGLYRYERYKKPDTKKIRLVLPEQCDGITQSLIAEAVGWGRDLINTPANDMGPAEIEQAARQLADQFGARFTAITGDDLLAQNFPMIHAVGRASTRAPRLIDLVWGDPAHKKVTLIGKGVAFDTGGLNIKPDASMLLMKKDMGGAASALTAARMIMASGLKVRLRVLIPAVENAISGSAFRPGDVLPSRKGLSVEIGNTDAEGRLILADALALADEEQPDLILQFATLTGAARVALGPDLPPYYAKNETLSKRIQTLGLATHDPVWPMPLWNRYRSMLASKIADINHVSSGGFAGSITAALFLDRFVEKAGDYVHFDIFGWTPAARPGRSEGGEPQAARLIYELIKQDYCA